ncbi:MAG: acetylxylan esterase [Lentisphaeria bacterium]|nr:acetylxylan esterase [Lentisphaeria bacterium]
MLYTRLTRTADELTRASMAELPPLEEWTAGLPEKRRQWLEMLGLDPLPERMPLRAVETGRLQRGDMVVEKMHFQPIPGCRIAANIYRPKDIEHPLPAVIYVCGHAARGKFHYQEHPRWFGQHGYIAMILDAIQIGENDGFHHGTHRNSWWHWISQGYSPAAVEVWAAMRAADYLQERTDVDGERLGITGNSGGGTISWFTGAADPRFKVVVPSCQTGSVSQHIRERTVDGHCDCSFWTNTYGWDLPDLASLICPRPLLVAAASKDTLFRSYAFREVVTKAQELYALHGCEENIDLVEADTPHGYSPKTRLSIFSWFDRHLKDSDTPATEDISAERDNDVELSVYREGKPPSGDCMRDIDRTFIPLPDSPDPSSLHEWEMHRQKAMEKLKARSFRQIPSTLPVPEVTIREQGTHDSVRFLTLEFESEPGLPVRVQLALPADCPEPIPIVVGAMDPQARSSFLAQGAGVQSVPATMAGHACVEVRGTGATSIGPGLEWTMRRAYPIVGQTLWERRVFDFLVALQALRTLPEIADVVAFGKGEQAVVALYAALLDHDIAELVLHTPATTHWDSGPEILSVLQTGDLPHNAALLCPRPLTFVGALPDAYNWTRACYELCEQTHGVRVIPDLAAWTPFAE